MYICCYEPEDTALQLVGVKLYWPNISAILKDLWGTAMKRRCTEKNCNIRHVHHLEEPSSVCSMSYKLLFQKGSKHFQISKWRPHNIHIFLLWTRARKITVNVSWKRSNYVCCKGGTTRWYRVFTPYVINIALEKLLRLLNEFSR